jgi:hypothetical protein
MRNVILVAALLLPLAACRGERAEPAEERAAVSTASSAASTGATGTAASNAAAAPAGTAPLAVTVKRADGAELLTVKETDGIVDITLTGAAGRQTLRGEPRDSGKRKYHLGDAAVSFEVKPNEEGGFKLRTADGKLRWKVKITSEKIKISDNEQNDHPFELKVREGGRTKVFAPGDRELGNVRFDRAAGKSDVEDAAGKVLYTAEGSAPSGAYGVLLFDGIPEVERAILLAEIFSRGR